MDELDPVSVGPSFEVVRGPLGAERVSSFVGSRCWFRLLGAWFSYSDRMVREVEQAGRYLSSGVLDRIEGERELLGAVLVSPVSVSVLGPIPGDFFTRGQSVVVGEAWGLVLRHPDPFPPMVLFPRLARAWGRVRR